MKWFLDCSAEAIHKLQLTQRMQRQLDCWPEPHSVGYWLGWMAFWAVVGLGLVAVLRWRWPHPWAIGGAWVFTVLMVGHTGYQWIAG
ncbi:MAG TPA: hypothetical protein VND94_18910 [Terriglobia bacterium]|nr:hypothetical protein [Terriglobia bacterium]